MFVTPFCVGVGGEDVMEVFWGNLVHDLVGGNCSAEFLLSERVLHPSSDLRGRDRALDGLPGSHGSVLNSFKLGQIVAEPAPIHAAINAVQKFCTLITMTQSAVHSSSGSRLYKRHV